MHVTAPYQLRVVFHKESQHQHTDVHTVVIGIRCYDDVVVAQVLEVVLHSQG